MTKSQKIILATFLALLSAISCTPVSGQTPAAYKHVIVDQKEHTVFEQSIFFVNDPGGYDGNEPKYYLRTKLTRNGELIYIKDDDITNNSDQDLPRARKAQAFANMKKMLTIQTIINH